MSKCVKNEGPGASLLSDEDDSSAVSAIVCFEKSLSIERSLVVVFVVGLLPKNVRSIRGELLSRASGVISPPLSFCFEFESTKALLANSAVASLILAEPYAGHGARGSGLPAFCPIL